MLSAFWGVQSEQDEGVRLGGVARLMGGESKRRGRVVEAETLMRTCEGGASGPGSSAELANRTGRRAEVHPAVGDQIPGPLSGSRTRNSLHYPGSPLPGRSGFQSSCRVPRLPRAVRAPGPLLVVCSWAGTLRVGFIPTSPSAPGPQVGSGRKAVRWELSLAPPEAEQRCGCD